MKVAALGDAHLGRSYFSYTTEQGFNQREVDFEDSFTRAVDLALAQSPDLVVWLGDIFDHPRPTYRSYRIAQRAMVRIREHGTPLVLITGNHDTPRLPGTGSPYSALADLFPEFHFAHRMAYERFVFPGLVVHAVPQMLTVEATLDALAEARLSRSTDATNLLLTHPRVPQVEPHHSDINEIEVDAGLLKSSADLALLGHYHFHTRVQDGIWYAGSTDTFSFADDPEIAKGIVVLDTDTGQIEHKALTGQRPLITVPAVHALGLSPAEVQERVLERVSAVPAGAVVRLYLEGVDPEAFRMLDMDAVRAASAHALHLKLEPDFAGTQTNVELPDLASLPVQWSNYVAGQDLVGFDRDRIRVKGDEYLARAVEEALD
ncbi:MAG TPA: DNA repair exonuclease [Acidimicrobiales bacterium]|nr:DNA repair exonuclease [Acidimicrobiales bacterium]